MNDYKHLPDHDDSLGGTMDADALDNTEQFQWQDYSKGKTLADYAPLIDRREKAKNDFFTGLTNTLIFTGVLALLIAMAVDVIGH